jgi:hypothetical protein
MATMFMTFFAAAGKGLAAAGAAASSAVSAVGGTASFLSGLSTVVGGLASIAAGNQQKAAAYAQAADEDMRAKQETLNGREAALGAMRKLNEDMAHITVAGYASGLQSSGSVQTAQDEAQRIGEINMDSARNNAKFAAGMRRSSAQQMRVEGDGAQTAGIFSAISGGLGMFSRKTARG